MMKKLLLILIIAIAILGSTSYCGSRELALPKYATVAVVIPEYVSERPRPVPDPAAQTTLKGYLRDHGYTVKELDIDVADARRMSNNSLYAARIARTHGVDVIIVGEANAQEAGRSAGMIIYRAIIEVRAVKASDGNVLFATVMTATGRDISEDIAAKKALRNAGRLIGEYICGADKVRFSVAANIVAQKNFPWRFPQSYVGWLFTEELYEYFDKNLPTRYRDSVVLMGVHTSSDMSVKNDLGDLLRMTFGYLIFAEIESLKADWSTDKYVEYDITIRYSIYNDEGEIVYKNRYIGHREGFEKNFCKGIREVERYYGSVFQQLIRDAVVDIYNKLLKPMMDIVDKEKTALASKPVTTAPSRPSGYTATERILAVHLITGEVYKGYLEGPFYVGEEAFLVDPNKLDYVVYIGGKMFKVVLLDGTIIKGKISPEKLRLRTKHWGTLTIDVDKIDKIETETSL